jgi:hypothetical protein
MAASEKNMKIFKSLLSAFEGKTGIFTYWDEDKKSSVDILSHDNHPAVGVTSYGTIGLSDHPMIQDGKVFPVRLELVGACTSDVETFANIISTAAFFIINDHFFCSPGAVLRNVIDMYDRTLELKHALFLPPFLWQGPLSSIDYQSTPIAWLLLVPITEQERQYLEDHGVDALEDLFVRKQIDVFDLLRKSVV